MHIKTIIGAEAAYACIKAAGISLDVRLSLGHSTQHSLRQTAAELRRDSARLQERATLMEQAADHLDEEQRRR